MMTNQSVDRLRLSSHEVQDCQRIPQYPESRVQRRYSQLRSNSQRANHRDNDAIAYNIDHESEPSGESEFSLTGHNRLPAGDFLGHPSPMKDVKATYDSRISNAAHPDPSLRVPLKPAPLNAQTAHRRETQVNVPPGTTPRTGRHLPANKGDPRNFRKSHLMWNQAKHIIDDFSELRRQKAANAAKPNTAKPLPPKPEMVQQHPTPVRLPTEPQCEQAHEQDHDHDHDTQTNLKSALKDITADIKTFVHRDHRSGSIRKNMIGWPKDAKKLPLNDEQAVGYHRFMVEKEQENRLMAANAAKTRQQDWPLRKPQRAERLLVDIEKRPQPDLVPSPSSSQLHTPISQELPAEANRKVSYPLGVFRHLPSDRLPRLEELPIRPISPFSKGIEDMLKKRCEETEYKSKLAKEAWTHQNATIDDDQISLSKPPPRSTFEKQEEQHSGTLKAMSPKVNQPSSPLVSPISVDEVEYRGNISPRSSVGSLRTLRYEKWLREKEQETAPPLPPLPANTFLSPTLTPQKSPKRQSKSRGAPGSKISDSPEYPRRDSVLDAPKSLGQDVSHLVNDSGRNTAFYAFWEDIFDARTTNSKSR